VKWIPAITTEITTSQVKSCLYKLYRHIALSMPILDALIIAIIIAFFIDIIKSKYYIQIKQRV